MPVVILTDSMNAHSRSVLIQSRRPVRYIVGRRQLVTRFIIIFFSSSSSLFLFGGGELSLLTPTIPAAAAAALGNISRSKSSGVRHMEISADQVSSPPSTAPVDAFGPTCLTSRLTGRCQSRESLLLAGVGGGGSTSNRKKENMWKCAAFFHRWVAWKLSID